jgi:hypothetical protein
MELNIGNKTYKSFSEYLDSDEYAEHLELIEQARAEYEIKAKVFFDQLDYDDRLLVFFHVMKTFYDNERIDKGSYRHLLYDKFGFDCDAYTVGMDCGCMELHNSIFHRQELIEGIEAIFKMLNIDHNNALINQALECIQFGRVPKKVNFNQLNFDFKD